jgi:hypothetical protein
MEYAAEMLSGAMTCMPSFIKIRSAIQELLGWGYIDTDNIWIT